MLIETQQLTKRYPGITALDHVDFTLEAGEVHILFGENGAGKSTLISMLAGANTPSSGRILLDGAPTNFHSVADAQDKGIFTVFQEFSLIPTMTVAQNIFLGREPRIGPLINHAKMKADARTLLHDLGFDIPVDQPVARLSRAAQQMVEIAKAFIGELKVLILDEPTASLTDREVSHLFDFVDRLKAEGVGVIYISHRMQEFSRIGDRITVLRDGAKIGTVTVAETNDEALVEMMTGRTISEIYPPIAQQPGKDVLRVENLTAPGVSQASFSVKAGEVLGIAGLVGAGKSRMLRAVMGLTDITSGRVLLDDQDITGMPTREIMARGVYYLAPDRKNEGLDLAKSALANIDVNLVMNPDFRRRGWIDWPAVRRRDAEIADYVELHAGFRPKLVSQLSGGNQQKVLFGKCFTQDARIYILDEPTVGVDMGTRAALYHLIKDLAEAGKAVVVISSDLSEVMHISHRLLVMSHGRLSAELSGEEIEEDSVLKYFFEEEEKVQHAS